MRFISAPETRADAYARFKRYDRPWNSVVPLGRIKSRSDAPLFFIDLPGDEYAREFDKHVHFDPADPKAGAKPPVVDDSVAGIKFEVFEFQDVE